jgi:uncharacterized protein (TIGR03546 family)
MFTRKLAKLLRGNATPAQIILACTLGVALGFMPGFAQAPGLIAFLILALIVSNANLALVALVAAPAKLLSLAMLPVTFTLGRAILDGPTQGLMKTMINAPVLALFGFEYYVTTGSLLLGVILGVVTGLMLVKIISTFRSTMARMEQNSDAYKRWVAKWWVKLLLYVLVGKGSKEEYAELLEKKGKVIRPVGVVLCVLVVGALFGLQSALAGPFITSALRAGLEQSNGATVDLEKADVDLAGGRMTLTGLALADPNALDTDLFRAATIEADLSATSLLRKRLKIDRIVVTDARNGAKRATPGKIVGNPPAPREPVEARPGEKLLGDYLGDAKEWQAKLAQVNQWIEKLSGPSQDAPATEDQPASETLAERLQREADQLGYARVTASHLIEGSPQLTIGELIADGIETEAFEGETIDLQAKNISTQPHLLPDSPSVSLTSSKNTLDFKLVMATGSQGDGKSAIKFAYRGLDADSIAESLASGGTKPISGGTIDVQLDGEIDTTGGATIDMPLTITLHNTTIAVAGAGSAPIEEMTIPLSLRGPIDNPRLRLDDTKLADALVAAGAGILANEVRGRADKAIGDALSNVKMKEGLPNLDLGKGLGKGLGEGLGGGLSALGGKKEEKKDKPDAEKKNGNDIQDAAKSLTEGLFGKKKKKKD